MVHNTHREFSGLAIDQAHEQANAVVKGDGGAIGITEDPSALRRWMVSGPEVSHLVSQYESTSQVKVASEDVRHHEQTSKSQKSFTDKVQNLFGVMKDLGNPFQEESRDLLSLETKTIAHPSAADLIITHLEKGSAVFRDFVNGLGDAASFYKPIKKNIPRYRVNEGAGAERRLSSLLTALLTCQSRECDLLELFFKHENQSFPAALSDTGKLHSG